MPNDSILIQIVDAALAEALRRSGPWLLCCPGSAQCCLGKFPVTQLDAVRLRTGLTDLQAREPERAARVRRRVRETVDHGTPMADDEECPRSIPIPAPATCTRRAP